MSDKDGKAAARLVEAGWRRTSVEMLGGPLLLFEAPDGDRTLGLVEALAELERDA